MSTAGRLVPKPSTQTHASTTSHPSPSNPYGEILRISNEISVSVPNHSNIKHQVNAKMKISPGGREEQEEESPRHSQLAKGQFWKRV